MNNNVEQSFGEFIAKKREEKKITLREMAKLLKITPPYLSDIEKDRRNSPEREKLDEIAAILSLRKTVSPDLPDYIMDRDYVRVALRTAMDLGAGEDEWMKFVEELKDRKG